MRQAECKSDQIFLEEVIDNVEHCFYLFNFRHGCFPVYCTKKRKSAFCRLICHYMSFVILPTELFRSTITVV
jgi:hypothetical protein